jgi:hypothetical protein
LFDLKEVRGNDAPDAFTKMDVDRRCHRLAYGRLGVEFAA